MKIGFGLILSFIAVFDSLDAQKDSSSFSNDTIPLSDKKIGEPVESWASYPGGEAELQKYLNANLQYPEDAKQNNINGEVKVSFVVSRGGFIQHPKIIKSLGYGCDEEALRLVKGMPNWIPAKHNGIILPVTMSIPIKFLHSS